MKNKAVFLDRDGLINKERGTYTWRIEDFEFVDGIFQSLDYLQQKGYLLIVITNQSGIAKGVFKAKDVEILHAYMTRQLEMQGIRIEEIYYCPHHEEISRCLCRKPGSLLIEKAIARFDIDREGSVMLGDSERDVEAGKRAGVHSVLIQPNSDISEILRQHNI